MGWWMVPTRIPDGANSNNIERACRDADMKTLCDHAAWNNGKCVALGSFHMSYNGHHPTFVPPYLTNKEFYAGQAYAGYAIQNTGGSHRWETGQPANQQTICVTRDSPIKFRIADPPLSTYSFSSCWNGCKCALLTSLCTRCPLTSLCAATATIIKPKKTPTRCAPLESLPRPRLHLLLKPAQAWCAQTNDGNQWNIVDLGQQRPPATCSLFFALVCAA
jgi:hypothetical protein